MNGTSRGLVLALIAVSAGLCAVVAGNVAAWLGAVPFAVAGAMAAVFISAATFGMAAYKFLRSEP